jgi:hypothetical protein
MTRTIGALATLLAVAAIANAQTTSPSTGSTLPPASDSGATTPGGRDTSAMSPAAVKSKIQASGFKNVTNIKKDRMGNWTANATKDSQQVAVSLDSKGMVKEVQQ